MLANVEFIILPYASRDGKSILDRLVKELEGGEWKTFRGAAAFAKQSGNDVGLLGALSSFAEKGGEISLTVGADVFGSNSRGTDLEAVETLLRAFEPYPSAKLYLYHERGRTFHPKLYLFANVAVDRALAIVGSSNWTEGGLAENIEANVVVRFDLTQPTHRTAFDEVTDILQRYWTEAE